MFDSLFPPAMVQGTRLREIKTEEHDMSESTGAPRDPKEMQVDDSDEKKREQEDMQRQSQSQGQSQGGDKQPESMDDSERRMEGAQGTA